MKVKEIYTTTKECQWSKAEIKEGLNPSKLKTVNSYREVIWKGFGGCFNELGKEVMDSLAIEKQEEIYNNLFSLNSGGLGLKYLRIPIGASDYAVDWYSLNETPGDYEMTHFTLERDKKRLIPYIKEALSRNQDIIFFASPWSPPTWMKNPQVYNYGRLIWTEANLRAYALYLARFIQEYKNEGIIIHQLHVQNEVTSDQKFPSCLWSAEQLKEFVSKYLGPLFEQFHINTQIWLGTINATGWNECPGSNRYNLYANPVLDDSETYSYIHGVSYQWEGKNALQVTVDSYPELEYIQSENECGDGNNTWEYAKYVFELMRHYISNGTCGYIYWNMILRNGGESTWGWKQNSMITIDNKGNVHYEYEFYVMKHVSRYVDTDAKVLRLEGHFSGTSIGFMNPNKSIVLIIQNPFSYEKSIAFEGQSFTLKADSINTILLQ